MTTIGSEELIYDLRKKIQQIQVDLNQLGDPVSEIPELISSANLLRANEYLSKANEKKTELLTIYAQYSTALEKLLSSVFDIQNEIRRITQIFAEFIHNSKSVKFEQNLLCELNKFNNKFFPSPSFRYKVRKKEINEWKFGRQKELEFKKVFQQLIEKYDLQIHQNKDKKFLDKWYLKPVRNEIDFVLQLINEIKNPDTRNVLKIILSRTVRSCRATTHSDLATLIKPITETYYCHKHYKICKPLFSIFSWWQRYSNDTIKRLSEFNQLRTNTYQFCLTGDSRNIDIFADLKNYNQDFADLVEKKKIKGISYY